MQLVLELSTFPWAIDSKNTTQLFVLKTCAPCWSRLGDISWACELRVGYFYGMSWSNVEECGAEFSFRFYVLITGKWCLVRFLSIEIQPRILRFLDCKWYLLQCIFHCFFTWEIVDFSVQFFLSSKIQHFWIKKHSLSAWMCPEANLKIAKSIFGNFLEIQRDLLLHRVFIDSDYTSRTKEASSFSTYPPETSPWPRQNHGAISRALLELVS